MPKERLQEVLEILSRYNSEQSVIDYYQLMGLNKNMTIEEIKNQLKKKRVQVLFHPDQINFVPEEYHEKYLKMIETTKDIINTFDNYQNKEAYDQKLEEYSNKKQTSSNGWEDKTEDLDEVNFQQAIILNSEKHGFEFTREAIIQLIKYNSTSGFTRTNNVRDIISNININKLKSIIASSSLNDRTNDLEQIVMNYLTDFVYNNSILSRQSTALEQACVETISKYDFNGRYGQTNMAVNKFSMTGDAGSFTNTNNARDNLVNNVNSRDVNFFIQCALNSERHLNPNLAYQNTKNMNKGNINKLYCDTIIEKLRESTYQSDNDNSYYR